ncbi:MAG TPA: hypothetical protein PLH91_05925 [Tenuifilaceae bacterium]|nr:hypothetical protein [Tenuifilaceae bacterium]HPI44748.1 hypothetical protein [Tenuifilaceae bacterium]HPN20617.1 hypothetical protein [Tenuifilaceae bacterium]HPV55727.1 hypothetical protein [Tenuifilaceae bacterium]
MKIAIIIISVFASIVFILVISGCSVVKTTAIVKANSTANIYYYLPKGLIDITSTVKVFIYSDKKTEHLKKIELISQSFDYTKEIVPDNSQVLKLNYTNNPFSKDNVDIKINDKGLLTNVDITTEDRLPNIIETLTSAPSAILSVGGTSKGEEDLKVEIEEFTKKFVLNPSEFPKEQIWVIAKHDKYGNLFDLDVSFTIQLVAPTKIGESSKISTDQKINGIVTRPLSLYKFSITPKAEMLTDYQIEFYEYLPNNELNITVPLSRALFSKKTNNLVLSDGLIKENKIDKPSEVEGFISIPINVAKAIVSVPGQLFQFRIDNTKKKTELEKEILNLEKAISDNERNELLSALETQKQQLEADKKLLTLQTELESLKNEISLMPQVSELENQKKLLGLEKEVSTLTNETQTLKETLVLQNEKTILQLQKEIEALKNEIENLKNE